MLEHFDHPSVIYFWEASYLGHCYVHIICNYCVTCNICVHFVYIMCNFFLLLSFLCPSSVMKMVMRMRGMRRIKKMEYN